MTTATPPSHLEIKDRLEHELNVVTEYEKTDDSKYPAWIFCILEVVTAYGVCPFLRRTDHVQRPVWLKSIHDHGELYKKSCKRLINFETKKELVIDVQTKEKILVEYLDGTLQKNGFTCPVEFECGKASPVKYLVENVKIYKSTTKNRNKATRDLWKTTLLYIDRLLYELGINFSKYLELVHDLSIRYKIPSSGFQINNEFEVLCESLQRAKCALVNEELYIQKQREEAVRKLANLIQINFTTDQSGRYFKRWSVLTDEQRIERIYSFALWYTANKSVSHELVPKLVEFVNNAIISNELKSADIKWSQKQGFITDINRLELTKDGPKLTDTFPNKKKTKTESVTISQIVSTIEAVETPFDDVSVGSTISTQVTKKRSSKRKCVLGEEDEHRLNRLLLYHLVNGDDTKRKDMVVKSVLDCFSKNNQKRGQILSYISFMFDKISNIIHETPVK